MLRPLGEAEPAEVVSTVAAFHVIAPLVLLDKTLALWARLRVCLDPRHVFARVLLFVNPEGNLVTSRGLMVLLLALEAEGITAEAIYYVYHTEGAELHDILAILLWTPLHVFVQVRELFAVPVDVLTVVINSVIIQFVFEVFQVERVRHRHIASWIGAFCEYALRSVALHFVFQIHLPTYLAELVATAQFIRVVIWIALLEFHVHHLAHIAVVFFSCRIYVRVLFDELLVVLEADFFHFVVTHGEPLLFQFLEAPVEMSEKRNGFIFAILKQLLNLIYNGRYHFLDFG